MVSRLINALARSERREPKSCCNCTRGEREHSVLVHSSSEFMKEAFSVTHCYFCFLVSLKRRNFLSEQGGLKNHGPFEMACGMLFS